MNHSEPTRFGSGRTAFLGMVLFIVVAALHGQNNIPRPSEPQPTRAECVIPTWLAPESSRIDEIVLKLHALQKLDAAAYKKEAPPTDCPQQLFKYRVSILDKVVALMERK